MVNDANDLANRTQALHTWLQEHIANSTEDKLVKHAQLQLSSVATLTRESPGSAQVLQIINEIEVQIRQSQFSAPSEIVRLLIQVSEVGAHATALSSTALTDRTTVAISQLIARLPENGATAYRDVNQLGGHLTIDFDLGNDQGQSAVSCLRETLYLATTVDGCTISAAIFRCVKHSHELTKAYIEIIRSYRAPTLILSADLEVSLPKWCMAGGAEKTADMLNKFTPFSQSGVEGSNLRNPGLKTVHFVKHRHGLSASAFSLVTATKDNGQVLFVAGDPDSTLRAHFLGARQYDDVLVDRITRASEVQILGMTNENLSAVLEAVMSERKGVPLKRLKIVFASETIVRLLPAAEGAVSPFFRRAAGLKTIQHIRNWAGGMLADDIEVRETSHPLPFVGARTRVDGGDWQCRIGLCVPLRRNMERPYIDAPDSQFGTVVNETFEFLISRARPILNRLVLGTIETSEAQGLIPMRLYDKAKLSDLPVDYVEANVLIIVYKKALRNNLLHLQRRTRFNSDDSQEKLSNLSARITESDCYVISEGIAGAHPLLDEEAAFEHLIQVLKLDEGQPLPDDVYRNAAVRECHAGLGLMVKGEAFADHGARYLQFEDGPKKVSRFFKILSLGLTPDEISSIKATRPHASLQPFGVGELDQSSLNAELNTFLKANLKEVFKPIFDTLKLRNR